MNNPKHEMIAITYVGSGKLGFYKDCSVNSERLRKSLERFGIQLVVYSFSDLRKLVRFPDSNFFYFFTRYGAGSWFWKPLVMLDALDKHNPKELIYLDADCVVNKDPREAIATNLTKHDVAVFRQNMKLLGWISGRATRILRLGIEDLQKTDLLTAGIVILKNSSNSRGFLNTWSLRMKDPRVLLHPAISNEVSHHRHDQTVLSTLVSKGDFKCRIMSSGFYSTGKESLEDRIENAWVYTGEIDKEIEGFYFLKRVLLVTDYYSRKAYDLIKSAVITPIHLMFYFAQRGSTRESRLIKIDDVT
jgi:hypothetical protein